MRSDAIWKDGNDDDDDDDVDVEDGPGCRERPTRNKDDELTPRRLK